MTFEVLPLVNRGGDRKSVALSYGASVRNIFDVDRSLRVDSYLKSAAGAEARTGEAERSTGTERVLPHRPHPIRFTFMDSDGRRYVNEEFELRFVDTWNPGGTNPRHVIKRRDRIGPAWALRRIVATSLRNWSARIAGPTKSNHA